MYDQAIKTYEEAKRHLDHKGFTRMYGRIKWELESKKTVSAYKKAKRRLDSRRVEGEIVYDHNTRNFRLYSDSLESRRLEEKTKREIASEMINTLANKQKVIIKVRRRKYLQNEQVSRIIRDNRPLAE